jgi:hypothetical protein
MMHLKTFLGYKHVAHLGVRILELPYEVCSPRSNECNRANSLL